MATSFSSDQTTLQKDTGTATVMRAARTRVTSIQGKGIAGSVLTLHDSATTGGAGAGNLKATYKYGTCLLYTSPSPRDRTRSRMPSSA